jgi:hypothetical protein
MKTERRKRYEIRYIEFDGWGHRPSSIVIRATRPTVAHFWFKYGNPDVRVLTCVELPA